MSDRPYPYIEYPRWVYKAGKAPKTVASDEEKAVALADGWSLVPVPDPEPMTAPATAPASDAPTRRHRKP